MQFFNGAFPIQPSLAEITESIQSASRSSTAKSKATRTRRMQVVEVIIEMN